MDMESSNILMDLNMKASGLKAIDMVLAYIQILMVKPLE